MTPFLIGLILAGACVAVGFRIGNYSAMRSVRVGAKWKLSYKEQQQLDELVEKAPRHSPKSQGCSKIPQYVSF